MGSDCGKTYLEEYFGKSTPLPVAVVACESDVQREYMRRLRRAGIAARFVQAVDSVTEAKEADTEQSRVIVALGGEKELNCAKYLAKIKGLPLLAVLTSPDASSACVGSAVMKQNDVLVPLPAAIPEKIYVAAEFMNKCDLPSAFGGICACALSAFDADFYARVTGAHPHEKEVSRALDIAYKALDEVKGSFRDDQGLLGKLCELSVEASGIGLAGAADDCARTATMLFRHESRAERSRGELVFIFGSALVNLYRESVSVSSSFVPPPDNNRRAELLTEYFGWNDFLSARAAVTRLGNSRLVAYRLKEYSDELRGEVRDVSALFDESRKYFRRLFPDDGFALQDYLDQSDLRTVLALAPDTFGDGKNALAVLRDLGLLERYL